MSRNGGIKPSKLLASAFAAVTAVSVLPVSAFAEENETSKNSELLIEVRESEIICPEESFSLSTGTIDLSSGNHEKWIDRIIIPEEVKEFYYNLYSWTDNNGSEDHLIDTSQLETVTTNSGIKYYAAKAFEVITDAEFSDTEWNYYFAAARAAYDAFDRDFPEVFWLNGKTKMLTQGYYTAEGKIKYIFYFGVASYDGTFNVLTDEYDSTADIKSGISSRNAYVSSIMNDAPSGTYEKVKYFNDWLTKHNEYNSLVANNIGGEASSVRECISALDGRIGNDGPVCEGYSRAMKVLCDTASIPCILVDGNAGGAHMWNYIKMDNNCWYLVDSTWNDPLGVSSGAVSGI